jgi:hypothetical protein
VEDLVDFSGLPVEKVVETIVKVHAYRREKTTPGNVVFRYLGVVYISPAGESAESLRARLGRALEAGNVVYPVFGASRMDEGGRDR